MPCVRHSEPHHGYAVTEAKVGALLVLRPKRQLHGACRGLGQDGRGSAIILNARMPTEPNITATTTTATSSAASAAATTAAAAVAALASGP